MYVVKPYFDDSNLHIPTTSSKMYNLPRYFDAMEFEIMCGPALKAKNESTKKKTKQPASVEGEAAAAKGDCSVGAKLSDEESVLAQRQKSLIDHLAIVKKQLDKVQAKVRNKSVEAVPKLLVSRKDKTRKVSKSFDYANFENSSTLNSIFGDSPCLHVSLAVPEKRLPFSLLVLLRLLTKRSILVSTVFYSHSALHSGNFAQLVKITSELSASSSDTVNPKLVIHVICTTANVPSLRLKAADPVLTGERAIAEYLAKLANLASGDAHDSSDKQWCDRIWSWLESSDRSVSGLTQILKDAESALAKSGYLCGGASASFADVCLWSTLCRVPLDPDQCKSLQKLQKWCQACGEESCFKGIADLAESYLSIDSN